MTGVTPSLAEYSYLVKKVLFNIDILPLTRIVSCFLVQIFLAVFTVIFFACFGYYPDVYYLQLPYYMLYMMVLLTGIGYCTAALYPFFRDLLQIVNIVMQVIFWLTPIVWNFNIMSETIRRILVLNPFYYVVAGYRDAFVYKAFFWENWKTGIYYWAVALIFLLGRQKSIPQNENALCGCAVRGTGDEQRYNDQNQRSEKRIQAVRQPSGPGAGGIQHYREEIQQGLPGAGTASP